MRIAAMRNNGRFVIKANAILNSQKGKKKAINGSELTTNWKWLCLWSSGRTNGRPFLCGILPSSDVWRFLNQCRNENATKCVL